MFAQNCIETSAEVTV